MTLIEFSGSQNTGSDRDCCFSRMAAKEVRRSSFCGISRIGSQILIDVCCSLQRYILRRGYPLYGLSSGIMGEK